MATKTDRGILLPPTKLANGRGVHGAASRDVVMIFACN